jgi:hypothetical protein
MITPENYDTDILSRRQFITASFDHTNISSQRQISTLQIKGTLNSLKQAFPV